VNLIIELTLLLAGLAMLVKGADWLVDGSCRLARSLGVSELIVGLTLVALGTSMPELAVAAIASLVHHADISVSNIIGSNIYNIFVIIGLTGLAMRNVVTNDKVLNRDAMWMVGASILFACLSLTGTITPLMGAVMIGLYATYIYNLYRDEKHDHDKTKHEKLEWRTLGLCLVGLAVILFGGSVTVTSAVNVARLIGIPEWIIGATVIAGGTSFPETATSLVAIAKRKFELSLGNIIGSNIANILLVIGVASVLNPLAVNFAAVAMDYSFMLLAAVFITVLLIRKRFGRLTGALSLLLYAAYIALLVT
jgi:cation:H+ antiporter